MSHEAVLVETLHRRHATEFSNVLAILHLLRAGLHEPHPIVDDAIERVEGQLELERLLVAPPILDLSMTLAATCELIAQSRVIRPVFSFQANACPAPSVTFARAFAIIAFEAISLITMHMDRADPPVIVRLALEDRIATLLIRRTSQPPGSMARLHRDDTSLMRQIVWRLNGSVAIAQDTRTRTIRIRIPVST
jgi:hypothetical protein